MAGLRVVDLGCGFGWFCRWAAEQGASSVVGIDLSARMLERADADTDDDTIAYERHDLESIELSTGAFDVAYSSLTLRYVIALERVLTQVHQSLAVGGTFVFSVEHPIFTAPSAPAFVSDSSGFCLVAARRVPERG